MHFLENLARVLADGEAESGKLMLGFSRGEGNWVMYKGSAVDDASLTKYDVASGAAACIGAVLP